MSMDEPEDVLADLRRRARKRVKVPATLMMVMAVLWVAMAVTFALYAGGAFGPRPDGGLAGLAYAWLVGPIGVVWGGTIAYGAYQMDRLGNYKAARLGAWVAVVPVPVPLYLLWLVGAILGLVALNDPGVRAAFASGNPGALDAYLARQRGRRTGRPRRTEDPPKDIGERAPRLIRPGETDESAPWLNPPLAEAVAEDGSDEQPYTDLEVAPSRNDRFRDPPRRNVSGVDPDAASTASTVLLVCWVPAALMAFGFLLVAGYSVAQGAAARPGVKDERPIFVAMGVIYPPVAVAGLYGALQLQRRRSRGWGTASAILLILAFPGCLIGIILGIWVLVLVNRSGGRRSYRRADSWD
jgi:hypothetical protein